MSRLPDLKHELFLGKTGFIGLRCACGFVVTARNIETIDAAMNEHFRAKHLDEAILSEDTLET